MTPFNSISSPQTQSIFYFLLFLHFLLHFSPNIPSRLFRFFLFSCHFFHFSPLSHRPLLSPGGTRQAGRFSVCAAVMAWAPIWGAFDGAGDYSSCSSGRVALSHNSSSITCMYRSAHKGTLLINIAAAKIHTLLYFDVSSVVVIRKLWSWDAMMILSSSSSAITI